MSEARRELLNVIARLDMMSHAPSMNLSPTPPATDAAKGGGRPAGGIDRKDDNDRDGFMLKSADHYRRRLARAHTEGAALAILSDAKKSLRAWTHTPIGDPEKEPKKGHPMFMRWVAEQRGSVEDVSRRTGVSRKTVYKYRDEYGTGRDAA